MNKIVALIALKAVLLGALATGVVLSMGGCNTMQGLGKDVSKLGDKIEQKADEKKKY
ncbi:MAG: entericidin A/B family lipoprotein [Sulfurimicrobium sp.]|jgi:predicted small secreted protein|nr:entericidin A/B family lipoprotein [Sulfurimicrobium sp.]MDZ7655454.1 entericidin A/B family lipoprotein [Sulfurimicrobium sp.]